MEIRISVRGLVEFLLRSGDIDNRKKAAPEDAMPVSYTHLDVYKRQGKDSGQAPERLFYAFDTPDQETEAAAEKWLSELTLSLIHI